jgi:bla regulator protein blaR1
VTAAVTLLSAYAVVIGTGAPRLLAAAAWSQRAPRLAIALWQTLSASLLLSLVLIGVIVAAHAADGVPGALHACSAAVQGQITTLPQASATLAGVVLAATVIIRSLASVLSTLLSGRRDRANHAQALAILGRPLPEQDAYLVDHPVPGVYCIPGREHRIVVTSGALGALANAELAAVLARERAHLTGRHHLVLATAEALHRAFPRVPLFSSATEELILLVEMMADDAASRRYGRNAVARALVTVATAAAPRAALSAGGAGVIVRVQRLLDPATPLSPLTRFTGTVAVAAAPVLPLVAVVMAGLPSP